MNLNNTYKELRDNKLIDTRNLELLVWLEGKLENELKSYRASLESEKDMYEITRLQGTIHGIKYVTGFINSVIKLFKEDSNG